MPDPIFDLPTRPATRYFVQYPTRPDPIMKNPTRWALIMSLLIRRVLYVNFVTVLWDIFLSYMKHLPEPLE